MNVTIIGTGYVGLVAGTCFAESGSDVTCVDINETRIQELQKGKAPFFEPGLEELIKRNTKHGRLLFTTDTAKAVKRAHIIFIAVGTPYSEEKEGELKFVKKVAESIGQHMDGYKVVVLKSTVPVGSANIVTSIIKKQTSHPFSVVSNPEFLKEGSAVNDFLKPERVVIGCKDKKAIETMKELYAPFVRSGNPVLVMDNLSAELSKYACNSYLATRISFINEIANLCSDLKANVDHVRKVMMTDARIGSKFLYPGTGYGGSCFPKDVKSLIKTASEQGRTLQMVSSTDRVNEQQKSVLFDKISAHYKGNLTSKVVAIWGLAFKPNTDDIREAPALIVIKKLLDAGASVRAYDPIANDNVKKVFEDRITICEDRYECIEKADALLILTEWNEFRNPDLKKIKSLLKNPLIFDGRNLFDLNETRAAGLHYEGIGL